PEMRALGSIIVVERPQDRAEDIGIDDRPGAAGIGSLIADWLPLLEPHLALEIARRVPPLEVANRCPIEQGSTESFGASNEGPRHPVSAYLVQTQYAERIVMRSRDDSSNIILVGFPGGRRHRHIRPQLVGTFQMSRAYSRIVRSDENQLICAVLRI